MAKNVYLIYSLKDKSLAEKFSESLSSANFNVIVIKDQINLVKGLNKEDIYTPIISSASLYDISFCTLLKSGISGSNNLIAIIRDAKAISLIAKNPDFSKIIDLGYVDLERDGMDLAIRNFVRLSASIKEKGSPKNLVIDHRLVNYLRKLQVRIGFISLPRVDINKEKVSLDQVYIPLYTTWSLGIDVKNYKIINWWIERNAQKSNSRDFSESLGGENFINLNDAADLRALQTLVSKVQKAIDNGIDSKYDDAGKRPLVLAPPWYDGIKENFWPIEILDIAATFDRLVVLGAPGSGKSTFMRYLSLCLLGSLLNPELPNSNIKHLGNWPHGAMIPVFVELRQLVGWSGFPDLNNSVTEDHFWKYITEELLNNDADTAKLLRSELLDGHGIIILDGLDEVPISEGTRPLERRRQQLKDLARELSTIYTKSRIIFTSRDYAYRDWILDGFTTIRLSSLDEDQMYELAIKLYYKHGHNNEDAQNKAAKLLSELKRVPAALKNYPLFLTLMANLFLMGEEEGLPTKKGDLYYKSIMLLLNRWTQPGSNEPSLADQIGCGVDKLFERLEVVAYKTHKESTVISETPSNIPRALLLDELFEIGGEENIAIAKLLSFVSEQAGVLISPEARVFQFAHRGFQEYLAASYLFRIVEEEFKKPDFEDNYRIAKQLIEQQPQIWREPCLLLSEVIVQKDRKDRLWDFVFSLISDDLKPKEFSTNSSRWWSIWLASRIMLDHKMLDGRVNRNRYIIDNLRKWIKELLNSGGSLPIHERVDAAILLGKLGDDRSGVGIKNLAPDIEWCSIPGDIYEIGTNETQMQYIQQQPWAKGCTFKRETPSKPVLLPNFQISVYPITQAQFLLFINDENGYKSQNWWTEAGWRWMKRNGRDNHNDRSENLNKPCVYVSWYEANAFCGWLSNKMNCNIGLPSEAQWEVAAKGRDSSRIFPWGNNFYQDYCNSRLLDFNTTLPVGCFNHLPSPWEPFGPYDLSGNVWEWCSTICELLGKDDAFPYPYNPDDGRENLDFGDECYRVVRGGSFLNPPFLLRCSYRGRDRPFNKAKRVGFRIIRY